MSLSLYCATDGDKIGARVGISRLADDDNEVRRVSRSIEQGNELFTAWALAVGGEVISDGGDETCLKIPADRLTELSKIRQQYAELTGATVSCGIGMRMSEADKSLLIAKKRGGSQVVLYTPELEEEIQELKDHPKSEEEKLSEAYLGKADPPQAPQPEHSPAMVQGTAAGFKGASQPTAPTTDKPQVEASEHSQGEAMNNLMENQNPGPPEMTHSVQDMEEASHALAAQQQGQDQAQALQQQGQEDVRAYVVQILQSLKQKAPVMEQIKQADPETYQTIVATVQAMITMAKQLMDSQEQAEGAQGQPQGEEQSQEESQVKKSEGEADLEKGVLDPNAGYVLTHEHHDLGNGQAVTNVNVHSPQGEHVGAATFAHQGKTLVPGSVAVQEAHQHKGIASAMYGHAQKLTGKTIVPSTNQTEEGAGLWAANAQHPQFGAGLGKTAIPSSKPPPAHTHLNLPVGSEKDGHIKVKHENGREGWVQVRSGVVLSRDGHAISSHHPDGQ